MRRLFLLLFLSLLPAAGCSQMVGGACEYKALIGTARIVQEEGKEPQARFYPAGKNLPETSVPVRAGMLFHLRQPTDSKRSDIHYPARLDVATKGSCTPYRFNLLASEYFSQGLFLPFDQNGKMTVGARKRLRPIAKTYQRLSSQWPNLVVELCGQSDREGPAEYNLSLTSHYAEQVANELKALKIPTYKLNQFGAGEEPCPRGDFFFDEVEHGIWVSFLLTGVDQISQADILLAEQGNRQTQEKLLNLINAEKTSEPDRKLAAQWIAKAAENSNPAAQYAIGLAYLQENGVKANLRAGIDWIKTAAYNNHPPAQRELAWMYFYGETIPQDHPRAYAWFLIAAENGDAEAQQEVQEYEKYVETALEYTQTELDAGRQLVHKLKSEIIKD